MNNLKSFKKFNLQELGCMYYTSVSNLKEEYLDMFDIEEETILLDYEIFNMVKDIRLVEYDSTDDIIINEEIDCIFPDYNHFLLVAYNHTWDKRTGYKIVNDKIDILLRDYDVSTYIVGATKNKKSILFQEFSHDCPTGYELLVIGLTDKEYEKIENYNFDKVLNFAKNNFNKIKKL